MTTEVLLRELQRDPDGVAALADRDDVRVQRRGGEPLLLLREDRAHAAADAALAVAGALRAALLHLDESAHEALTGEFPWVDLLPVDDRRHFVSEFARAVQTSAELGQWDVLSQALLEWRGTAAVHAEPALAAELSRPVEDDLGPVPAPEGLRASPVGWEPRFATSEAVKGWEELCRVAPATTGEAWVALVERPVGRQHRLRGRLAEREVGERRLQQWQYDVPGEGRIWYCPDAEQRVVRVVAAVPAR
ncbi:hypothetical protein [Pseudonocardia sp. DLS-67]